MKRKVLFLLLSTITCMIISNGYASDFKIKLKSDAPKLQYNNISQYLNMKLSQLDVPIEVTPPWYKKVFVKRKDFGIAYFDYSFKNGTKIKQPLFQYEKDGDDNYRYSYLVATESAPAYLLEKELVSRPFTMQLVIKNWESGENTSLLKVFVKKLNLFSSASPDVVSVSFKTALEIGNAALDSIEEIFPPKNTEESGLITIDPDNLKKKYFINLLDNDGNENLFSTLDVSFSKSLFIESGGFFEEAITRYNDKFKGISDWEDIVHSADQDTKSGDIGPILNTLATFNKYIASLKITNTDKVLLLAKAACRWAPTTIRQEYISASKFSEISVEGAKTVLVKYKDTTLSNCKFPVVDCHQPITCAAFDFYSKSSNTRLKNSTKIYIADTFDLSQADGSTKEVSIDDYLKYFKLRGRSSWKKTGERTNRTYIFDNRTVKVSYTKPNESYSGLVKSINFFRQNDKFYIGEILVE